MSFSTFQVSTAPANLFKWHNPLAASPLTRPANLFLAKGIYGRIIIRLSQRAIITAAPQLSSATPFAYIRDLTPRVGRQILHLGSGRSPGYPEGIAHFHFPHYDEIQSRHVYVLYNHFIPSIYLKFIPKV